MNSSVAPLQHPRFRLLWMASVISNIGSFFQGVAAGWLMLELTHSAWWVGLMAASATLPLLGLALPAGALADIVDRRRILLVSQTIMGSAALGMAAVVYFDVVTPWLLLTLGLVLGAGLAINLPAWQALVPDLVPRGLVASAVALNSVSFNVARAVGPALGGLIVATAGADVAFLLNSVSYVAVLSVILSWRGAEFRSGTPDEIGNAIALGLRFARFTPPFRRLLGAAAGFALTSAVVQSLLPNVTEEALAGGATMYGLLLGMMGLGALVSAFSRPRVQQRLGRLMVPSSIVGFGLAAAVVGLSRNPIITGAGMFAAGVFWVWTLSTLNATVQLLAPAWIRGRAMSLYTLAFVGILPLGSIAGGALGDVIGAPQAVAVFAVAILAFGLAIRLVGVPGLGEVVATEPPDDWNLMPHDFEMSGGPVMVVSTWEIRHAELDEFLQAMDRLRRVRLRTGAYRWRLYRSAEDPHRMTEVMVLNSWQDHIRQHQRIDAEAAEAIEAARAFDRGGGPITRHLVAVEVADVDERPRWEELLAVHRDLHDQDGSIPLGDEDVEMLERPG
jgi:MFS family permease